MAPSILKGGFVGVDIFFVISGYLISRIIFQDLSRDSMQLTAFYFRRIRRLLPSLLIVLICCLIYGWFSLLPDEYAQLAKHVLGGIGFVSNLVLLSESGYFDNTASAKPLLHLWSLGVEEQFYFLWPFLCLVVWRNQFNVQFIIYFLIGSSLAFSFFTTAHDKVEAFYSPLSRFWEILFGSLLAHISLSANRIQAKGYRWGSSAISCVGLVLILTGVCVSPATSFPVPAAILPTIGAVLVIYAGSASFVNRVLIENRLLRWFGSISYPLYLWHWPILTLILLSLREPPDRYIRVTAVLLSVLLAWMTHRFVESRIRSASGSQYILSILFLSFCVMFVAAFVHSKDGLPQRDGVMRSEFSQEVRRQFMGPLWPYMTNKACLDEYHFRDLSELAWWFCMKSSSVNPPTILLLGNSFANQLYPGFASNPNLRHHSILSIGTCSIVEKEDITDPRNPCFSSRLHQQTDFINDLILRTPSLQFAILDGLPASPTTSDISRIIKRIQFLERAGLKVVVFVPHMRLSYHPKNCFDTPLRDRRNDCQVPLTDRLQLSENFSPLVSALKTSFPSALVFDQNEIFCDRKDNQCSFKRDGLPLLRDETHLSEYASILLMTYFNKWAQGNLPFIFDESDR